MNFSRVLAVIIRHLYNFKHNLERLTDSFYWPALDILLWGITTQYIQQANQKVSNLVLVFLSGLIFWQVIWRSQYEITVNFLEELWNQNLVNLFATPLRVEEWITAVFSLGFINMIVSVSFAGLVAWLLYSVNILNFGWLLLPFFASLLIVGWWVGLIVSGLISLFGKNIQSLAWAGVTLLAPFSALYYPVSSLPVWAQKIARILPSSYIFEGMRKVLSTGKVPFVNLVISFGLNFVYLLLSYFFFKYCFAKSREKGLARLE
ncbi:MAG TPA: ABC transporter permease [Candidatus Bathyarchaeia archaeon]|nr:ABC transporter permease [Candidatus Bathyarchaeia archaeon]